LVLHGSAAAVGQVLQKQLPPPPAVHGRLVPSVDVPVVAGLKLTARSPMFDAACGGQSKLVVPKNGFTPALSHGMPSRGPPTHAPCARPSRAVASPAHLGHGLVALMPLYTLDVRCTSEAPFPALVPVLAMLRVPANVPLKRFTTQTGTPPEESGSGGP
jgi:hypothetical protein